jgi:hypothetical protein
LGFATNTNENFIVGDSFLINYYSIFDDDNSMLTLAPKIGALFSTIDLGADPTREYTAWDNPNVYAPVFTLFAIIMSGGAAFAILTKMGII